MFRPKFSASLTYAQQLGRMSQDFPYFKGRMKRNSIQWRGELKPFGSSRLYLVEIEYQLRKRVRVRVIRPILETLPGKKIPHTFSDGTLCLHTPDEWNSSMQISQTILPWVSEWLFFYEVWLAAGEWEGGGHEPADWERAS